LYKKIYWIPKQK